MSASSATKRTRWARWPKPTRRGTALIVVGSALFVTALFLDRRDLILVSLIAVAMPLLALLTVSLRGLRLHVTRRPARQVAEAGGSITVALLVRNLGRRATDAARWRDSVPAGLVGPPPSVLPALGRYEGGQPAGDDSVRLEYTLRLSHRGTFQVGPLLAGLSDPFGLVLLERPVGQPLELIVTPRVTALDAGEHGERSIDGALRDLQRQHHTNVDELIAREYRHGDPLRRVNWPATARHGELMVRHEEQRSNPEARLIIDTATSGRRGRPRSTQAEQFDHEFELGIEIAASVGVHVLEAGFRLHVSEIGSGGFDDASGGDEEQRFLSTPMRFSMPGGQSALLERLAHIRSPEHNRLALPSGRASRGLFRTGGGVGARGSLVQPGFAVLVDIDEHDTRALVHARQSFEPAVAFVLHSLQPSTVDELTGAGWQCVLVESARDLPQAWASIDVPLRRSGHAR